MAWEIVVGIETHAQLLTKSKIFSGASTAFGAAPNTQASAVDLALPGVLPVLNRGAVELAIRFGLAVGKPEFINRRSIFARKNYFYPDLPKGYQISQFEHPIVTGGSVEIQTDKGPKMIRLTRAHLEEDAGKSLHEDFHGMSGIDLNRAGTPLLEIVSEPELESASEAVSYAKALHEIVTWNGICDGNMQEGSFRCDANVSVKRKGEKTLGTRCEIKNLNSFQFMEEAIKFEAARQIELLESGGTVVQETRLYDPDRGETRAMRSKEDAQDYRYFPDPDLLPLVVSDEDISIIFRMKREPRVVRRNRFISEYFLSPYQAEVLTATYAQSEYFEEALQNLLAIFKHLPLEKFQIPYDERPLVAEFVQREVVEIHASLVANTVMQEIAARLNRENLDIEKCPMRPTGLAQLLAKRIDKTLSANLAKEVFDAMWAGEGMPDQIIEKRGLKQISDAGAIEKIVDEVMAASAKLVEDYRSGKEKAFNALVGQVMKRSQGKANPAQVNEILRRKLKG